MAFSKQKLTKMKSKLLEIESILDALNTQIFGANQLKKLLREIVNEHFRNENISIENLKIFLIENCGLSKVGFQTPRLETLYLWRRVDAYNLMPAIRSRGYYTHLTALFLHGLLDYEPASVYFNNEQPARPKGGGGLEQSRIDNAFKNKQRITTAKTDYENKVYWLLNGKQTGNYGVISIKTPSGIDVPVTNLERTLIDIAVRPAYCEGVALVLKAFKLAQPKVSSEKLIKTLETLNYVYPYHQSIGFYMDKAGVYTQEEIEKIKSYKPLTYNFYLDYQMINPAYSEKWKLYYSQDLAD